MTRPLAADETATEHVGMSRPRVAPVSAVVCAYTLDRWPDLVAAIDSARAQEPPPAEVVLVVDHNPELLARATST